MTIIVQDEVEVSAVKTTKEPTTLKYAQAAASAVVASPSTSKENMLSAWNEPPKIVDQSKKTLLSSQYSSTESKSESDVRLPASLADLAPCFESIKNKALRKQDNSQYTNLMLDASLQHVPDLIDSERPKVYQPRNPFNTPNYYPQQPLAIFDNPVLFDKFDMDTLFYIFYYQQGTYQQ